MKVICALAAALLVGCSGGGRTELWVNFATQAILMEVQLELQGLSNEDLLKRKDLIEGIYGPMESATSALEEYKLSIEAEIEERGLS